MAAKNRSRARDLIRSTDSDTNWFSMIHERLLQLQRLLSHGPTIKLSILVSRAKIMVVITFHVDRVPRREKRFVRLILK